jgi:hypothetical protein
LLCLGLFSTPATAAVFTVTTTADSGAGSLRQAITDANASAADDIIEFNFAAGTAPYTITLRSALPSIATTSTAGTLTITGLGASSLTIDANQGNFSIFSINAAGNLTISGVTVTGANSAGTGGAFNNSGTLTITNSTISGNTASEGGGIVNNNSGTLTVNNSTISSNVSGFAGGGIRNSFGIVTVTNSTISLNTSLFSAGISATGGTATVANSTLFENNATALGGGIGIFNGGTVFVFNSTLSGNAAGSAGGGIYADGGNTLNIANTIIANSTSGGDFAGSGTVNVTSPATAAHNLVSQGTFSWATTKTSLQVNLGPLADNGGPTKTLALLAGSVAINAGDASISNAAPVNGLDQRGVARSTSAPSIGAFEYINAANTPTFGTPTATADGFTVQISNYDANFAYGGTATAGGTVSISGAGLVTVSGVAPNTSSTATVTTTRTNYAGGSAQVTAVSLAAPGAPTVVSAIAGNSQATVTFTAPVSNGGAAITSYTVTSSPGGLTGTGSASPITVTGLTNGTSYTFTVTATNSVGTGSASAASNSVTPAAPLATSYTGTTAGGSVTAAITGGSCAGFQDGSAQYNMPATAPAGRRFPYGAFSFTVLSCGPGGSVTITQTYPNSIAPNAMYHKLINGNWVDWTANVTIVGNTVMLTLTDGQSGDTNPTAGEISDPGGITVADDSGMAPIPTLSAWMLMVMAGLMAFVAIRRASAVAKAHMSSQV